MNLKYCLPALLCLCLTADLCPGQTTIRPALSRLHPLAIGALCPDIPLPMATGHQQHLSSYKGKPLILVSMSIYCGTCVQELPQLQNLQNRLGDSLTILLVLREQKADVTAFFSANAYARKSRLPIIISTAQINKLFPHAIFPHVVWLSRQHAVAAITGNRSVTEDNLRLLATGQTLYLPQKHDLLRFDESKPVLTGSPQTGTANQYTSALGGFIDGAGSSSGIYHDDTLHTRYLCLNVSIPYLYQTVTGYPNNLILPEVRNRQRLMQQNTPEWEERNLYTYELVAPATLPFRDAQQLQRADFDRYLGYHSGFEKRRITSWALVKKDTPVSGSQDTSRVFRISSSDSEWTAAHITGAELVNAMNNMVSVGGPIFLDETGDGWISLHAVVPDVNNIAALRQALQQNGLDLEPRTQTLDVFVIRDAEDSSAISRSKETTP